MVFVESSLITLYRPRPLELSAADKVLALENLDVLQANGFDVVVENGSEGEKQGDLLLVSQPVSKSTVFDISGASTISRVSVLTGD